MSSPALDRGLRKLGRTALQVVASGGATAVTDLLLDLVGTRMGPEARTIVAFLWLLFFTFVQNTLETRGTIPTLLPAPGLITEAPRKVLTKTVGTIPDAVGTTVGTTVGTVATTVDEAGQLTGDVLDVAGDVVGGVTGAVGGLLGDKDEDPPNKEFDH